MLHKWQSLYLQPCTGLYEHIILGSVPAFYSRAKFKIVILEIIVYFLVLMCIFCRLVKISSFQISIVINIIYFGLKCPKCNFLLNRQELNRHRLCTTAGVRPKKDKKNPPKKPGSVVFSSTFTCFNLTHSNCALSVWRRRTTKLRAFNCKLSCYLCYYLAVFVFCCTDWVGLYNTCSMTRIIYQTHSTNCREHFSECLYVCVHTTVIAKICLTSVNSYPFYMLCWLICYLNSSIFVNISVSFLETCM